VIKLRVKYTLPTRGLAYLHVGGLETNTLPIRRGNLFSHRPAKSRVVPLLTAPLSLPHPKSSSVLKKIQIWRTYGIASHS
jgi:hypothetical protein